MISLRGSSLLYFKSINRGNIERIGLSSATLAYTDIDEGKPNSFNFASSEYVAAINLLIAGLYPHLKNVKPVVSGHHSAPFSTTAPDFRLLAS